MSSEGQKTKQELLQEYENNYLKKLDDDRVEEKEKEEESKMNITPNSLQSFIFTASKENKKQEAKEFIDYCVVCNKGVGKKEMVYKNDHLFHPDCFKQHGSEYRSPNNQERENTLAKILLVKLKNLQSVQISKPETRQKPKKMAKKRKAPKRKTAKKTVKRRKVTKKRVMKKSKRRTRRR